LLWAYPSATPAAIRRADDWYERLIGTTGYGGPLRRYHNLDHLVHGLTEIRVWGLNTNASAGSIALLKKTFWFHDFVHGAAATDAAALSDEEQSARLWLSSRLDPAVADDVAALIRATDHLQIDDIEHPLKATMVSLDLAILGQDADVYDAYAASIRDEYPDVPDPVYRTKRVEVLTYLHGKAEAGRLYADAYFAAQYNRTAMANTQREIARLEAD
jgi:pantetheine-phosphate adenylyltransferase